MFIEFECFTHTNARRSIVLHQTDQGLSNVLEVVQAAQQAHSFSLILSIFQVDRLPIVEVKLGAAGFQ